MRDVRARPAVTTSGVAVESRRRARRRRRHPPTPASPSSIRSITVSITFTSRVALRVALDQRPAARSAGRCGRACPRPPPRTESRFSRLRQSSSVSFHCFSGSFSRRLKRFSCSSSEMCIQSLIRIIPSSASDALEVVDLVVGAQPLLARRRTPRPARPAPARTRSGRRRPSRPSPAARGQKRQRKWWRFSSGVGAANWTTRTWRGSIGATSRLIAPPLPDASQPSNSDARPAGRSPARRSGRRASAAAARSRAQAFSSPRSSSLRESDLREIDLVEPAHRREPIAASGHRVRPGGSAARSDEASARSQADSSRRRRGRS